MNEYLEGHECLKCPDGYFSVLGSIGRASCLKRAACQSSDYTFEVSHCQNDRRKLMFDLRQPQLCSLAEPGAVQKPSDVTVFCRGCGRGEFRNATTDTCQNCPDGFFQSVDNHQMENGTKIQRCLECPQGHYAPKMSDLGHFESMPPVFSPSCSLSTAVGNPFLCSVHLGWHVNSKQHLLSNAAHRGVPAGLKFSLKAFIRVQNQSGGRLLLTFKMTNFTTNETFRILINGVSQFQSSTDTVSTEDGINLEPSNEQLEGFVYFESGLIPYGNNSIEISVLSNVE